MIDVREVSKKYGKKLVVNEVSFQVNKGEIFGLMGPNGAGKSTILGMMATVITPTAGDILFDGNSVFKDKSKIRKIISYVPQRVALHTSLTVKDNLNFWGNISDTEVSTDHVEYIAGIIGLQERLNEKVERLSEGMKRRLNIGVALMHNPSVLIMDEPTLGVDIKSKKEIVDFINTLADWGKTIVYTSHDVREISQLCHRVALLNYGQIMFSGSLEEAFHEADKQGIKTSASKEEVNDLEMILSELGKWWE